MGNTLTEDQINEILNSGDPDQIDLLMSSLEETEEGFEVGEMATSELEVVEGAEGDELDAQIQEQQEQEDVAAAKPAPTPDEQLEIEGKHGKHTIPYSELENTRKELQDAQSKLQEMQDRVAQSEKVQRQLDLLTKQLNDHGLDPETLPEDVQWTDELKAALVEDYGDAGKIMVSMKDEIERLKQPGQPAQQPTQQTVDDDPLATESIAAFQRNDLLVGWNKSDPARWEDAMRIDSQLQADPKFQKTSFDERYAEVARRVQVMYGDQPADSDKNIQDKLKQAKDDADAQTSLPNSLTDLGSGASAAERPLIERLADMDYEQVEAEMAKLTPAQQEALLAQIG